MNCLLSVYTLLRNSAPVNSLIDLLLAFSFRHGLVTTQQHADLASLLFQVQVECNVMSGLCKSVNVSQKL